MTRPYKCPVIAGSDKKPRTKAPKIQRLVTPLVLQRKRHRLALKKRRAAKKRDDAAEYAKLLAQRMKEAKERKLERRRWVLVIDGLGGRFSVFGVSSNPEHVGAYS